MKTLDELWYGNISPFEQCTRAEKRLKELLKLVVRNREELGESLTDKQKETLEKFEDCMNEMHSITERDAFSYAYRLVSPLRTTEKQIRLFYSTCARVFLAHSFMLSLSTPKIEV